MSFENLEDFKIKEGDQEGKLRWNFSAGPCVLPRAILDKAAEQMVDFRGTGLSVMELTHRS